MTSKDGGADKFTNQLKAAIKGRQPEQEETPLPDDHIEIFEAFDRLRPLLFKTDAQPPLTLMELTLIEAGPATRSSPAPSFGSLPSGASLAVNSDALAAFQGAEHRNNLIELQDAKCYLWLAARSLIRCLPDGREVVPRDELIGLAKPGLPAEFKLAISDRTGRPGAPSSSHLVEDEFQRRACAGETLSTLAAESLALSTWLRATHPGLRPMKATTVQNSIRQAYRNRKPTK